MNRMQNQNKSVEGDITTNMNILIVTRGYPSLKYPGNGIFEFDQARALAEAGNKVILAAVDLRSFRRWRKWGVKHFMKDGVEIYTINIPVGRVPHCILRYAGQFGICILYRLIKRKHCEPDIVHAHFLLMAEIALALKPQLSAAFVVTEHWSALNNKYETFPQWVKDNARDIYSQYNKVIAVSAALSDSIKKNFGIDPVVVPNMLDPVFLSNDVKHTEHMDFTFVFVGNCISGKSPLECIKAFYEAFHRDKFATYDGRKINLRFIGDGILMNDCRQLIKKLQLEKNVFMMGRKTRNIVAEVLRASDCFVLPSKRETFGVAYIEAMACGLPVIATKCGGPECFVNKNNGVLIPTNDERALIDAFQYMLHNINKYNKECIANDIQKKYSPQTIANQLMSVYRLLESK